MTIGKKLISGFAVALLFLIAIGWIAFDNTAKLLDARERVAHANDVLTALDHLLTALVDAETGQRGFMLTHEDAYLEPYNAALRTLRETSDEVDRAVMESPKQQGRMLALKPVIGAKLSELDETIRVARSAGNAAALDIVRSGRGKKAMDDIRAIVTDMKSDEFVAQRQADSDARARADVTFRTITYGTSLAAVLLMVIGFLVTRSVTQSLNETISNLTASSAEILAGTTQQASSAQEQAAAVSQTVTTVDEVTQTADQAAQRGKAVADDAQRSLEVSRSGRKAVEDSIACMATVKEQTEGLAEAFLALAERAQAIAEIIAAVNDIAEQTNLLALNAGIEASRAGEQGRAFSVVAAEIKALADQSKKATGQVRQILGEIQRATNTAVIAAEEATKSVNGGMKVVGLAGETIRSLADTIDEAAQAAAQMAASAGQQSTGMSQIHQAMRNVNQATNQSLASTRQAERAAQALNALGVKLQEMIAG